MRSSRRVVSTIKSEKRVQARRKQLISAAMTVFLRKGFHQATVRDVGIEAGLTQGTIYNYVRSKDDILYLVCDEAITSYEQAVRKAIKQASGRRIRLHSIIRAIVEAAHDHQEHILLVYQEGHALGTASKRAILSRYDAFNQFIAGVLRDAVGEGASGIRNDTLRTNIVTFVPGIVALRRWAFKGRISRRDLLDEVTEFIARGLNCDQGAVLHADLQTQARSVEVLPTDQDQLRRRLA